MLDKKIKRIRRHNRVRAKITGTVSVPRLCVFRSSNHIYAQLIDDGKGKIITSTNDIAIKKTKGKIDTAKEVGKAIAKLAIEKKIEKVVFDRAGYLYHGRVKAVAEGAREGGLKF
ncbi:MAG: 50S ribosomal protein L18 [Candidatus Nealsonbacteria bacterium]